GLAAVCVYCRHKEVHLVTFLLLHSHTHATLTPLTAHCQLPTYSAHPPMLQSPHYCCRHADIFLTFPFLVLRSGTAQVVHHSPAIAVRMLRHGFCRCRR